MVRVSLAWTLLTLFAAVASAMAATPPQVAAAPGPDRCDTCPAGYYAPGYSNTTCLACSAGTYSGPGASVCKACPTGTFSKRASVSCMPCRGGTFNSKTGQAACIPAPAGSYVAGTGQKIYAKCPPGSYSNATGRVACRKCASGTYQPLRGQTSCKRCCSAGTSVASGTCNAWTNGNAGATKCSVVYASRKMMQP